MLQIQEQIRLGPHTTLRIGGPARFYAEIATEAELVEALEYDGPLFILGGGSNLLVPDEGFPGLVLHLAITGPIVTRENEVEVPAGTEWDALVLHLCRQGRSGMECLAGIPGLVGGAPIQNIGAYGQEAAETIHSVRAYDRESKKFVTLPREACRFAYRSSLFNTTARNRYIVTQVTFALDPEVKPNLTYADLRKHFGPDATPAPLEVYHAVRAIRAAKGMLLVEGDPDCRSAGSFFKNPVVPPFALAPIAAALAIPEERIPRYPASGGNLKLPAAWLLDQAGFHKSFALGEAGISSKHTLALINRGHATYADIAALRALIVETVATRFGITLEQEPVEPHV
ncbi:UDP-N-acetylmuramate dehydrogenase [Granulicella pectinivorans]|uniref:UDP-N-acetylenolpyruvoylglucosamine reductase n=1 Tax=Granulicella pectinivorans TaxID=474950 RepID=A0A1I6MS75_9BACT|nr:UDP-N-acetylmuramate dehydrogenase [Granulicella pectinivorans]SFS18471.1 UDP-N-acetylmuramate dehydrogenase [Granulicella pectinivorans]